MLTALMTEAVFSSETSLSAYKTKRCHNSVVDFLPSQLLHTLLCAMERVLTTTDRLTLILQRPHV